MTNSLKRRALAIVAVLLLSVPSALGVARALEPTRGAIAAYLAAAGFELVYLSTAILMLSAELRRYAQRVALAAVASAVLLNVLSDYGQRVPGGLISSAAFVTRFDALAIVLALVESLPLAGLAFAMASLLHKLGDATPTSTPAERVSAAPMGRAVLASVQPAESVRSSVRLDVQTDSVKAQSVQTAPADRTCKYCGRGGLTAIEVARHGRARARAGVCPE